MLCDEHREDSEVVYAVTETGDNEDSIFRTAARIHRTHRVPVAVSDATTATGYPGFIKWAGKLRSHYRVSEIICIRPPAGGALNTNTEFLEFVLVAREEGWRAVTIVASPFHQPRSFINAVTAAIRIYPDLCIYGAVGVAQNWLEDVRYSQGIHMGARARLVHAEMDRIRRYTTQGDLLPASEILDYLNARDARVHSS